MLITKVPVAESQAVKNPAQKHLVVNKHHDFDLRHNQAPWLCHSVTAGVLEVLLAGLPVQLISRASMNSGSTHVQAPVIN